MYAQLVSSALCGAETRFVRVEVDLSPGLPGFHVVGLPDAAVAEAVHRVRSALRSLGHPLPPRRLTVNLAPGDLRKEGPRFDLAIALGVLAACEVIPIDALEGAMVLGELSLNGKVRPVRGAVGAALAAGERGIRRLLVPAANAAELAHLGVEAVSVLPVRDLAGLVACLRGEAVAPAPLEPVQAALNSDEDEEGADLALVAGQTLACRALQLAAVGGHHLIWVGPPGCGKTLLSRCLPGLMPDLSAQQATEVAVLRSSLGLPARLSRRPPLSAPHSGVTPVALLGGHQPGEISRAHNGVLFLDEMTEFAPVALDGLRTALESGEIEVSRARQRYRYPARFQLLAACNPCPCGRWGVPEQACSCPVHRRAAYMARLSGPLRDRIDLQVQVQRPSSYSLFDGGTLSSAEARDKVLAARAFARSRGVLNRDLPRSYFTPETLEPEALSYLQGWCEQKMVSARGFDRVLRLARSAADLAEQPQVGLKQVCEVLNYRCLDQWDEDQAARAG